VTVDALGGEKSHETAWIGIVPGGPEPNCRDA
jgi:hypothetical protein